MNREIQSISMYLVALLRPLEEVRQDVESSWLRFVDGHEKEPALAYARTLDKLEQTIDRYKTLLKTLQEWDDANGK